MIYLREITKCKKRGGRDFDQLISDWLIEQDSNIFSQFLNKKLFCFCGAYSKKCLGGLKCLKTN